MGFLTTGEKDTEKKWKTQASVRVAAIKSASTIRKISSFSMSVVSAAGREELDLADLLACGAMCSSILVCNTAVQCPKYKFQGLWSF